MRTCRTTYPDSSLHNRLGMYEEARGNFDAAVTQYELAIQANPRRINRTGFGAPKLPCACRIPRRRQRVV